MREHIKLLQRQSYMMRFNSNEIFVEKILNINIFLIYFNIFNLQFNFPKKCYERILSLIPIVRIETAERLFYQVTIVMKKIII
jgi:hypothetical protein